MKLFLFLPFAAAIFSVLLAIVGARGKRRSAARWWFCFGMLILAVDSCLSGIALRTNDLSLMITSLNLRFTVKAFIPAAWLGFSLTFSRGDNRESLRRWAIPLGLVILLPIVITLALHQQLLDMVVTGVDDQAIQFRFGSGGRAVNIVQLIALVWILMNLEQTFRSAVGTMRWRIKFVVLGLATIFGSHVYVRSEALLFSAYDVRWAGLEASALLIGCVLLTVAHARTGFAEIEVYPSRALLRSSLTVLVVGGYLFVVGVLANIAARFGGAESFQFQSFILLLGGAGLAVLLLSDRLRQRLQNFVTRHFARAQHDSVRIWAEFSRRLASVKDQPSLCAVSARLISQMFAVLSVTVWHLDRENDEFVVGASTAPTTDKSVPDGGQPRAPATVVAGLREIASPCNLEELQAPWAEEFRKLNPPTFPNGGDRWCVRLHAGDQVLGAVVLGDRINGAVYTGEQLQLLQCIGDQMTSVLLNLRLADEVTRSRELEAFRTMSAFFVHDLKNAATSLNLMLTNLPAHFADPAFRRDALRGIANTAGRIDEMIRRLTALRQRPEFHPVETDLNQLVREALDTAGTMPHIELATELSPLPHVLVDREQMQSVVTNLVLNARDAVEGSGRIQVRTEQHGSTVVLSIEDNGCGMSPEFVKNSLFRPFQSTKKKGLGIGMYQSRMFVEGHGGTIRVESECGKGTTFRVSLPLAMRNEQNYATDC